MNFLRYIKAFSRKIWFALPSLIILAGLTGCTDELTINDPTHTAGSEEEGDCLLFTFSLDKDPSTRDGNDNFSFVSGTDVTKYENYIDTQDKLRVFFFTAEGDFLFGANDRVVGGLSSTGSTGYWYVRIPMTKIVDREGDEYDVDKIKNYLKNYPFKIAVLANWPNGGEKINPADWDDSEGTGSASQNPSSTLKGNPHWNWSNSILNFDIKDSKQIRNINDLHHIYNDLYYGGEARLSIYEKFMDGPKPGDEEGYYMGEPTDWVKMRNIPDGWKGSYLLSEVVSSFDNKITANQWIRENWSPEVDLNQKKKIYRHYQHMWFLWNFDASFKYGLWKNATDGLKEEYVNLGYNQSYEANWGWKDDSPAEVVNRWGEEWYNRNGEILYGWMKNSYNNGLSNVAIGSKTINIGESTNDVFFNYKGDSSHPAYCVKVGDNYGIQLPVVNVATVNSATTGLMNFQARTSGTLRIKWGSRDGTPSTLVVQNGDGRQSTIINKSHSGYNKTAPIDWTNPDDNLPYIDISVEGGSEPMYIYCKSGKAVVYAVEFIRGRYLYETDREGVAPNAMQGIPMYGVKDFDPIGDWQRGTTITLNGNINLVRALAKVEVFIKRGFGKPRHVYMRNINRAARCEPMDVESDTEKYWKDNHAYTSQNEDGEEIINQPCEWFDVQKYGPSYGAGNSYSEWLSWFYGSWNSTNWKTSNEAEPYRKDYDLGYFVPNNPGRTHSGWKNNMVKKDDKSPHFFNPYNYRSDFCRFLETSETGSGDNDYYHYILYLPEKYIDDPSVAGDFSSTPRVPHIEYRFYPLDVDPTTDEVIEDDGINGFDDERYNNTEYNLDDNQSYRIYFTNYGKSGDDNQDINKYTDINDELVNGDWNRDTYDSYEQNRDRLSKHWPIMRNHSYKFYVGGEGPQNPEIFVEVSDWKHRKVVVQW